MPGLSRPIKVAKPVEAKVAKPGEAKVAKPVEAKRNVPPHVSARTPEGTQRHYAQWLSAAAEA